MGKSKKECKALKSKIKTLEHNRKKTAAARAKAQDAYDAKLEKLLKKVEPEYKAFRKAIKADKALKKAIQKQKAKLADNCGSKPAKKASKTVEQAAATPKVIAKKPSATNSRTGSVSKSTRAEASQAEAAPVKAVAKKAPVKKATKPARKPATRKTATPKAKVPTRKATTAKKPATRKTTSTKDNLKRIEGIGVKIEQLLNADGIMKFAQLSKATQARLKKIMDAAGPRFRMHSPATWPKQAGIAAKGDFAALKKWQDELKGGREVK